MDYVILCAVSGLIALLLCEYLSIAPRRKELEELKRRNEDNLRELYNLRGQNACLSEELEQLKAKSKDDLRNLREENDGLRSERDKLNEVLFSIGVVTGRIHARVESVGKEMDRLRTENEALKKELLEQVENQTEKSDAES